MSEENTRHDDALGSAVALVEAAIASRLVTTIPEVIDALKNLYAAVAGLGEPVVIAPEALVPAVSIKKSITADYLISLEDGKRYKSLKRHLGGRGLTPAEYRAKWGLPSDYPMVAPTYAKQRSELAKSMGLGRQRKPVEDAAPVKPVAKARKGG